MSSATEQSSKSADSTAGECTEHWWAIEGEDWVCSLCGKSEKAQDPDYALREVSAGNKSFWRDHALGWAMAQGATTKLLDQAEVVLGRLVQHADDMESQHEDYHNSEGPLRSQVLCEAISFLDCLRAAAPAAPSDNKPERSIADETGGGK